MMKLRERVSGSNPTFNRSVISGQEFNLKRFSEEIERLPVFAESRLVEVQNPIASKISEKDFKDLEEMLSDIPETTVVVFFYQTDELNVKEKASDKKFLKLIEKLGFSVNFSLKDEGWLIKFLTAQLNEHNLEIDYDAAKNIVINSNGEIAFLRNEIEKLINYQSEGRITKETAELVCSKSIEASRYDLSRFIVERRSAKALEEIDRLFFMRVKPTVILSAIYSAFFDIYLVLCASVEKKNDSDITADFKGYKGREFVLSKARRNASSYDKKTLEEILNLIISAESTLKGSRVDSRLIIEELAVKIMGMPRR
jgi:DNA polymerase-3 subunit delta